ncbi:hypothetical protein R5O87_16215 [Arthrobacter globiformis]|uniref:hypothetical protein n=1 Tax=Arthrobacter globiformis TaxID=1665 RepID=UPI00397C622D
MPRKRPPADTKHVSRVWRAVSVTGMAMMLASAPAIAQATFTGKTSGQVTASSLTLAAPVGASVTAACGNGRALDVTVNSYGTVPRATSYQFILLDPNGTAVQTTGGSYSAHPAARGTWTYQVRGNYTAAPGNVWTGTPYQGTVTC